MPQRTGYAGILVDPSDVPFSVADSWVPYSGRFYAACMNDLNRIYGRPIGRDLLDLIGKRHQGIGTKESGRTVTIKPQISNVSGVGGKTGPVAGAREGDKLRLGNYGDRLRLPGKGLSCTVRYAAFMTDGTDYLTQHQGAPSFITLAHELIHALHYLSGTVEAESVTDPKGREVRREEMLTTGLGPYANTRISENAIRGEHNLSRREHYTFPGDHMLIKPLGLDVRGLPLPQQSRFGYLCNFLWDIMLSFNTG